MEGKSNKVIFVRAPARLADALAQEAQRRTISKSDLVRLALIRELGLPTSSPNAGSQAQEVKT